MRLTHGHALPCFCILRDTALLCVFVHSVTLCYAAFLVYSVTLHSDAFLHSPQYRVPTRFCTLRNTAFSRVSAIRNTVFRRVFAQSAIPRSDAFLHSPRYRYICLSITPACSSIRPRTISTALIFAELPSAGLSRQRSGRRFLSHVAAADKSGGTSFSVLVTSV